MDINSKKINSNKDPVKAFNLRLLGHVEHAFLLVIAIATVYAMATEVYSMIKIAQATLADLLLLFIYLEVLAMVGQYYSVGKLSVRFPLYIAMVALARYIIMDVKSMEDWRMLAVTGAILLLTMSVFLVRYGHVRYPFREHDTAMDTHRDPPKH